MSVLSFRCLLYKQSDHCCLWDTWVFWFHIRPIIMLTNLYFNVWIESNKEVCKSSLMRTTMMGLSSRWCEQNWWHVAFYVNAMLTVHVCLMMNHHVHIVFEMPDAQSKSPCCLWYVQPTWLSYLKGNMPCYLWDAWCTTKMSMLPLICVTYNKNGHVVFGMYN